MIEEAGDMPRSHSVACTAEEELALDAEMHVSSFSINLDEDDDVDWEESTPQPAETATAFNEASKSFIDVLFITYIPLL